MDYLGNATLSVRNIEVNPLTKSEIQPWRQIHRKVPIATIRSSNEDKDRAIFGSDEIVRTLLFEYPMIRTQLEERWNTMPSPPMTWEAFVSDQEEWSHFATHELAVWLYPNMCRTWKDSYNAFDYIHRQPFSNLQRFLIQNIGSLVRWTLLRISLPSNLLTFLVPVLCPYLWQRMQGYVLCCE
jgi:hypothetical protein